MLSVAAAASALPSTVVGPEVHDVIGRGVLEVPLIGDGASGLLRSSTLVDQQHGSGCRRQPASWFGGIVAVRLSV
jgi:hypothetical protein